MENQPLKINSGLNSVAYRVDVQNIISSIKLLIDDNE